MTENMPKSPTIGDNEFDILVGKAREHHMAGRFGEAERLYRDILEARPGAAEVLSKLGAALAAQGKFVESISSLRRAIENDPDLAEAHTNLGSVFQAQGKLEEAIPPLRRALEINPEQAAAHVNLGNIFLKQDNAEDAAQCFQKALGVQPGSPQALNGLGTAMMHQNMGFEAEEAFQQALDISPDQPEILCNLGTLYRNQRKYDEAVETLRKAISVQPKLTEAHINLGNALKSRGDWDDALDAYEGALALEPDNAETHWNQAQVLLMLGRFREGWKEYEWRTRCEGFQSLLWNAGVTPWDGSHLDGKTILLNCEQGFGDSIQFVRYAQTIAEMNGTVIVKCPPQLRTLFETVPGVDRVVTRLNRSVLFDVEASLPSLPKLLATDLDTIPAGVPYFTAPTDDTGTLNADDKLKVGIVWAGNPAHKNDQNRSIGLNVLAPLLNVEGIAFFSLQVGEGSQDIERFGLSQNIVDLGQDLGDFAATAKVLEALDLIISVDTSVVHLAGALGKPVWTLLPFVPDWRWLLKRDDSPWYPSMRLFRQQSPGDWQGVIESVETALRQRLMN